METEWGVWFNKCCDGWRAIRSGEKWITTKGISEIKCATHFIGTKANDHPKTKQALEYVNDI